MKRFIPLLAVSAAISLATPAQADVINFDSLAEGDVVTTQFPGVTFSSQTGLEILVTAQAGAFGTSLPNFICTGAGSISCTGAVYVDFASAVSGLTFLAVGDDNTGDIGDVRAFAGALLLGTIDIIGDGNPFGSPYLVDLSAFSGVTRIEIANIRDEFGLGYDDFTFDASDGAVPEPSTWAMMLLGFGAVGFAMRRRKVAAGLVRLA